MSSQLGVTLPVALEIIVATVGVYVTLLVLIRVAGPRTVTAMTTTDVACVAAIGAVAGRTTLLVNPTLATGVIALVVLVALQRLSGRARVLDRPAVVLMVDGVVDHPALRRAGLDEDHLRQRLRLAGITRPQQVWRAVLERNGQVSVLRAGVEEPDTWIVADVAAGT